MTTNGDGRVIAEFVDYVEMLAALRERARELKIAGGDFDEFAGLPRGYLSKLTSPRPVRRLGMTSFGPVIAALGLRCAFIEDIEGTKRIKSRVKPAHMEQMRGGATHFALSTRFFKKIGRLGAQARIARTTPKQRSEWSRKAARARWHGQANGGSQ